jgi:glutamyl/glutaminyl-tRNA synthetase
MTDENGQRLSKRDKALSLRSLREQGVRPEELRSKFQQLETLDRP